MTFNTIEDINGTQFNNQGFWWYELDTRVIDPDGTAEFENVKFDFCTITKTSDPSNTAWEYTIIIDNPLWTTGVVTLDKDDIFIDDKIKVTGNTFPTIAKTSESF